MEVQQGSIVITRLRKEVTRKCGHRCRHETQKQHPLNGLAQFAKSLPVGEPIKQNGGEQNPDGQVHQYGVQVTNVFRKTHLLRIPLSQKLQHEDIDVPLVSNRLTRVRQGR